MRRGRRPLPHDELTEGGKISREYREKMNQNEVEETRKKRKAYYLKNKSIQQIQKRNINKKRRLEATELLGGKCMSCGELYNPAARISNLQFDHLSYPRSGRKAFYYYDILELAKNGVDPKEQFALLCRTCHMIDTFIRKNPQKAILQISRLEKLGIIDLN